MNTPTTNSQTTDPEAPALPLMIACCALACCVSWARNEGGSSGDNPLPGAHEVDRVATKALRALSYDPGVSTADADKLVTELEAMQPSEGPLALPVELVMATGLVRNLNTFALVGDLAAPRAVACSVEALQAVPMERAGLFLLGGDTREELFLTLSGALYHRKMPSVDDLRQQTLRPVEHEEILQILREHPKVKELQLAFTAPR